METRKQKGVIEGLLFASGDKGLTKKKIAGILEIPEKSVKQLLDEMMYGYMKNDRGLLLMQSKHAFHLTTKPDHSSYIKSLFETAQPQTLSQAALETLAIIAYQQPITRAEIDELRGVQSDRSIQTLLARPLIEEVGRKQSIGRPLLFGTSKEFLTFFGLTSLEELPPLSESNESGELEEEADLFFNQLHQQINPDDQQA
jgi:segregation and condensation protein B